MNVSSLIYMGAMYEDYIVIKYLIWHDSADVDMLELFTYFFSPYLIKEKQNKTSLSSSYNHKYFNEQIVYCLSPSV